MSRWTDALAKARGHKTKSARLTTHEHTGDGFPSKFEAAIHQELMLKEQAGLFRDVRRQQTIHLAGKFRWKVDFIVFDVERGCDVAHEAKGVSGERFRAVLQLWSELGPMPLIVYYQTRGGYRVKEYRGK
jgi:hypothetical protein